MEGFGRELWRLGDEKKNFDSRSVSAEENLVFTTKTRRHEGKFNRRKLRERRRE